MSAYTVADGVVVLDPYWSAVERWALGVAESVLDAQGLVYLATPSLVPPEIYARQGLVDHLGQPLLGLALGANRQWRLTGSAEQGMLARFADQRVATGQWWSRNQCFRAEPRYEGMKWCREFVKVEQFALCAPADSATQFEALLANALAICEALGLTVRTRSCDDDPGYHARKVDIEVHTKAYGWLETHSCTDFGSAQTERFGITGPEGEPLASCSNTGIASPRVLVPLMEAAGVAVGPYAGA